MPFRYTLVFGRKNRNDQWEYVDGVSAHHIIDLTAIGNKTGGHWGIWDNCLEWWATDFVSAKPAQLARV